MRSTVFAAVGLTAIVGLAGCTSSATGGGHPTTRPTAGDVSSTAGAARALPAGVVGATRVPATVPNSARLRADVMLSSCSAHGEGWAAGGTVRNPDRKASRRYLITVFFTTDHATVIGTGTATVAVPAGKSRPWSVRAAFHPASPTLCVLRGVGPPRHRSHA